MAIKYKVSKCSNPSGAAGVEYASCRVTYEKTKKPLDFVKSIEQDTTYTRADIIGVITAMHVKLLEHLRDGKHVDLKDGITNFGILSPGLKSRCYAQTAIASATFNPLSYIEGVKLNFRPSTELLGDFKLKAKLELVPSDLYSRGGNQAPPQGGGDDEDGDN